MQTGMRRCQHAPLSNTVIFAYGCVQGSSQTRRQNAFWTLFKELFETTSLAALALKSFMVGRGQEWRASARGWSAARLEIHQEGRAQGEKESEGGNRAGHEQQEGYRILHEDASGIREMFAPCPWPAHISCRLSAHLHMRFLLPFVDPHSFEFTLS